MTRLAALLCALASPAAAQDARVWTGTLHEPFSVTIHVHAPDGYVAVPRSIVVPEDETMALHIFQWIGG